MICYDMIRHCAPRRHRLSAAVLPGRHACTHVHIRAEPCVHTLVYMFTHMPAHMPAHVGCVDIRNAPSICAQACIEHIVRARCTRRVGTPSVMPMKLSAEHAIGDADAHEYRNYLHLMDESSCTSGDVMT